VKPYEIVDEAIADLEAAATWYEEQREGLGVSNVLDLRIPPANRLEKLAGDRLGQYSIRINDQWRVCFRWSGGDAHEVEIVDYH
jgi:hypothetical protein